MNPPVGVARVLETEDLELRPLRGVLLWRLSDGSALLEGHLAQCGPWGVEYRLHKDPVHRDSFQRSLGVILERLGLADRSVQIEVRPNVPRAMGLGGSAAMAVAILPDMNGLPWMMLSSCMTLHASMPKRRASLIAM